MKRNKNRGYQKLRVWSDAVEYFERLDDLAFKLENGLLKLVQSIEEKRELGEWTDHLMVKESNVAYAVE